MILPSGISTSDYSRLANSKGWGAGWQGCTAINSGQIVQVRLARSGTSIAGGIHRSLAELFLLIGNEIERRGYMFHPGWCWGAECRAISGSNTPSNHSWGLAVDINAPNNPYTSSGVHDIPDWAYALFRQYGFGLGADYSGKKDYMHVEALGTPSDVAIMTVLARKNIGGINTPAPIPTPPPTPIPTPVPTPSGDDDDMRYQLVKGDSGTGAVFAYCPGRFFHVPSPHHLDVGHGMGIWDETQIRVTGLGDLDVLRDNCCGNSDSETPEAKGVNIVNGLPSDIAQGK